MIEKTFKFLALKLITILLISFSYNINAVVKKNNKGISFEGIMKPFLSIIKKKQDSDLPAVNVKKKIVRAPAVNLAKKISTLDDSEKVKVNNELRMLGISFRELPDCIEDDTKKIVAKFDTTNITDDIHSVLSSILVKLNRNSFLGEEYSKKECLDFFNKIEEIISEPSVLDAISTTIKDLVFVPLCQVRAMLEYNSKLRKSEIAHHISEKMEEIVSYIDEEIKRRNIFGSASFTKAIKNFRNIDFENFDTGIKRLSSYEYFLEVVKTHTKHLYAVGIGTAALISGLLAIKLLGGFGRKSPIDKASEAMVSMCASASAACAMSSGTASLDILLVRLTAIFNIENEVSFKSEFGLFLQDFCLLVEGLNPGLGGVYSGLIPLLREAKKSPSRENCTKIILYIEHSLKEARDEIRRNQLPTIMSKSIFSEDVSKQMLDTFQKMSEMFNGSTGNHLCRAFANMGDACKTISGFYWNGLSVGVNNVPAHKLAEFDQARSELITQLKAINDEGMPEGTRSFITELLQLLDESLTRDGPESFIAISAKLKVLVSDSIIFTEIKNRIERFDNHPTTTIIRLAEGVQPPAVSPGAGVPVGGAVGSGAVSPGAGAPPQVSDYLNIASSMASKKVSGLLQTATASLEGRVQPTAVSPGAVSPVGAEAVVPAGAVVPAEAGELQQQFSALGSALSAVASQKAECLCKVASDMASKKASDLVIEAKADVLQKCQDVTRNTLDSLSRFAREHPRQSTAIASCCALPLCLVAATAAATAAASPLLATGATVAALGLAATTVNKVQKYGRATVAPAVSPGGVAAPVPQVPAVGALSPEVVPAGESPVPVGAVVSAEGEPDTAGEVVAPAPPPAVDVESPASDPAAVVSAGAVEAPADPSAGAVGPVVDVRAVAAPAGAAGLGQSFIEASKNYKKSTAAVVGALGLGSALAVGAVTAPVAAGIYCVGAGIGAVAEFAKRRREPIPNDQEII